jgi:hypothetical protein
MGYWTDDAPEPGFHTRDGDGCDAEFFAHDSWSKSQAGVDAKVFSLKPGL